MALVVSLGSRLDAWFVDTGGPKNTCLPGSNSFFKFHFIQLFYNKGVYISWTINRSGR